MESASIIAELKHICNYNEYPLASTLFTLYRDIIQHKDFIRENAPNDLYESLCVELDCVFNEARFGNGDDLDMVYEDCINVLKQIVEVL